MCKFNKAWIGQCKEPNAPGSEMCEKHKDLKCYSCGEPATHECDATNGLVCGADLCDNCEHTICSNGCSGGADLPPGMKAHCKKDEQGYYSWLAKDEMQKAEVYIVRNFSHIDIGKEYEVPLFQDCYHAPKLISRYKVTANKKRLLMLGDKLEPSFVEKAETYARLCHSSTNHYYDNQPYADAHLEPVVNVALQFVHEIPEKEDIENVIAACWCHDVEEDTRQTFNDVKKATNFRVAELVHAVTNHKGKSRKERANAAYYEGIRNVRHATFVKLADRIANVQHSKKTGSGMFHMYQKEYNDFLMNLHSSDDYSDMWQYLYDLIKE